MRAALRLLANVKPRYLEAYAPTGLTGLYTHPSPRPSLIYIYHQTLERLKSFPESSAYRQSVEATTRHRLNIIESKIPPGFEAWQERVNKLLAAEPERFASIKRPAGPFAYVGKPSEPEGYDDPRGLSWDGEGPEEYDTDGPTRTPEEDAYLDKMVEENNARTDTFRLEMKLEAEPALTADQYANPPHPARYPDANAYHRVSEIEKEIGHGLIEEIAEVASAELKLVDELREAKV